jgi:polar amino acid transport system substrate-binding protein
MNRFRRTTHRAVPVFLFIFLLGTLSPSLPRLVAQEGEGSGGSAAGKAEAGETIGETTGETAGSEIGGEEEDQAEGHAGARDEPVRVAVLNNFPPFSFDVRGKIMGFTIDYLRLLEEKTGLSLKLVPGTWEDNLDKFKRGEVDLITAISYTEDRTAFTRYSKPYYLIPTVVYIQEDSFSYQGVEDLLGKTVGIEADVYYKQYLRNYPEIDIVEIEDTNDLLRSLSFGEVDAVVTNINIGNYMIKKHMLENVELAGRIDISGIEDEDLRIGVRRSEERLHALIQNGINRISPYEYKELQDRWVGFTPREMRDMLMPKEQNLVEEYEDDHGGIRLSVHPNWYPVDFIDRQNTHGGISAEIFGKVGEEHDIEFISRITDSFEKSVENVVEGRADLLPAVVPTPELRKKLSFTKPYLSLQLVLATRSSEFFVGSPANLSDKHIAVVDRGTLLRVLENKYPDLTFHEVEDVAEGLRMVRDEEVFAYIGTIPTIAHGIQSSDFYNIKISGRLEERLPISAAASEGNEALVGVIDKVLQGMELEEREAVVNRWISVGLEEKVDYTIVWRIVAVAGIAAFLAIVWMRKEKVYNRRISRVNELLEEKNRELERLTITNQLTGLYNRRKIDTELENEFERSLRYERPFSIIMFDIDWFKSINDEFGHQAGDEVLKEIGERVRERVRSADIPGRWGGEEFLVVCPETDIQGAEKLAEAIRLDIEEHDFPVDRRITVSVGVVECDREHDVEEMIRRADSYLYEAKKQGKNRVISGR